MKTIAAYLLGIISVWLWQRIQDTLYEAAEYAAIENAEADAMLEFACGYDNRIEVFEEFLERIP